MQSTQKLYSSNRVLEYFLLVLFIKVQVKSPKNYSIKSKNGKKATKVLIKNIDHFIFKNDLITRTKI